MAREGVIVEIKHTQGAKNTTGILRPLKEKGGAAGADIYYTAPASLELSINDIVEFKLGKSVKPNDRDSGREVIVTKIIQKK